MGLPAVRLVANPRFRQTANVLSQYTYVHNDTYDTAPFSAHTTWSWMFHFCKLSLFFRKEIETDRHDLLIPMLFSRVSSVLCVHRFEKCSLSTTCQTEDNSTPVKCTLVQKIENQNICLDSAAISYDLSFYKY